LFSSEKYIAFVWSSGHCFGAGKIEKKVSKELKEK